MIRLGLHLRPWRSGMLQLHTRTKRINKVHQKFIDNGMMTILASGKNQGTLKWNKKPDEREYEKLTGMFSEFESEIPTLMLFDKLVSEWASDTKCPEFAERWLNFRLQKKCSRAVKVSLILDYIKSVTGLRPEEIDEEKVINTINGIKTDLMKVDNFTFSKVIKPLCTINRYKYCMELMREYVQKNGEGVFFLPHTLGNCLPHFIDAAIRNNDLKFAAGIIKEHKDVAHQFILSLWECLLQHSDTLSVDCIFELLSSLDNVNLPHAAENDLLQVLERDEKQWMVFRNSTIKDKHCGNCGEKIEPCFFGEEGIEMLKTNISATLERYNRERFEAFLQFLHFLKDVNYVVDGMWLNHHFQRRESNARYKTVKMEDYLYHFLPGRKLIIGRNIFFHRHKDIFDSPNIIGFPVNFSSDERIKFASSLDDLFVLYAALHLNQSCYIVTGDFMRDHLSKLNSNLQQLSSRWLSSKCLMIENITSARSWKFPISTKPFVKTEKGWHIGIANKINSPEVWCIQECK